MVATSTIRMPPRSFRGPAIVRASWPAQEHRALGARACRRRRAGRDRSALVAPRAHQDLRRQSRVPPCQPRESPTGQTIAPTAEPQRAVEARASARAANGSASRATRPARSRGGTQAVAGRHLPDCPPDLRPDFPRCQRGSYRVLRPNLGKRNCPRSGATDRFLGGPVPSQRLREAAPPPPPTPLGQTNGRGPGQWRRGERRGRFPVPVVSDGRPAQGLRAVDTTAHRARRARKRSSCSRSPATARWPRARREDIGRSPRTIWPPCARSPTPIRSPRSPRSSRGPCIRVHLASSTPVEADHRLVEGLS